jgi:multiple sugar transport system permease protein
MRTFFERSPLTQILYYLLNIGLGLLFLLPFYWTVATSLKIAPNVRRYPPQLFPDPVTFENYSAVWVQREDFPLWYTNSLVVGVFTVICVVVISGLAGYGFARFQFPGRELLFFSILISMMIPGQSLLVSLFEIMKRLNLINTRTVLVVIYTTGQLAFSIFLMRNAFEAIPSALLEAAKIDGCGDVGALFRIALPLVLPSIATVAVFAFIAAWNEFIVALIFTTTDPMKTVPVGLNILLGVYGTNWQNLTAVATLASIPPIVLFMLAQRLFIRGITSGAIR